MSKNSPEITEKRLASRKEAEAKKIFDLCGWEVFIDSLNYQIRKDGKRYYWTTFINMLKGLKKELDIKSVNNSVDLNDAVSRVEINNEKFLKGLKAILDSYTSLGELEWH